MTRLSPHSSHAALELLLPGLTPIPVDAPLSLWLLDHAAPFDSGLLPWLSEAERNHARRFHFAWHGQRYLAAHVALRGLLADCTGIAPSALRFDKGANGKPMLKGEEMPPFSLSHSPSHSLIGVGIGHAVGVDLEQERIIPDADELADLYFTPAEQRILSRAPQGKERSLTFLHGWTRKEACLKALGVGLGYPPSLLETRPSTGRTTVALPCAMHAAADSLMVKRHVLSWSQILPPSKPLNGAQASPSG